MREFCVNELCIVLHRTANWATGAPVTLGKIKPGATLLATENPRVGGSIPPLATKYQMGPAGPIWYLVALGRLV